MKKNTLLFDMDNCSVNWEGKGSMLHAIWKEKFPQLEFLGGKRSSFWNMADNYDEKYFEQITEIYRRPKEGFYLAMPPMEGFLDQLPFLADHGHIAFVSTPIARSFFDTTDPFERKEYVEYYNRVSNEKTCWIEEYIAPILGRMPETIFVQDKSHAHGTLLFDDNPHVTEKVCMQPFWKHILYTGEGEGFLFSRDVQNVCKTSWTSEDFMSTVLDAINDAKKHRR